MKYAFRGLGWSSQDPKWELHLGTPARSSPERRTPWQQRNGAYGDGEVRFSPRHVMDGLLHRQHMRCGVI
jgi:hypothetical protein